MKSKLLLLTLSLFGYTFTQAQVDDSSTQQEKGEVFQVVEEMPQFPGGNDALFEYLSNNLEYPEEAVENGIKGVVYVTFIVEHDGSISNVKVLRGIGGGCDDAAHATVTNMPNWSPGKQRGKPVRVQYNLPIRFTP